LIEEPQILWRLYDLAYGPETTLKNIIRPLVERINELLREKPHVAIAQASGANVIKLAEKTA
jgi:hypothetical protein